MVVFDDQTCHELLVRGAGIACAVPAIDTGPVAFPHDSHLTPRPADPVWLPLGGAEGGAGVDLTALARLWPPDTRHHPRRGPPPWSIERVD